VPSAGRPHRDRGAGTPCAALAHSVSRVRADARSCSGSPRRRRDAGQSAGMTTIRCSAPAAVAGDSPQRSAHL